MTEQDILLAKDTLNKMTMPVHFDPESGFIEDSENRPICEIRGWGVFQKFSNAEERQDALGHYLAKLINEQK